MKYITVIIGLVLCIPLVSGGKVVYPYSLSCESDSMFPWYKCGDTLYATTFEVDCFQIGNVYCYSPDYRWWRTHYRYICHRLMAEHDGWFYFKGDNNNFVDTPVQGKYIALELRNEV